MNYSVGEHKHSTQVNEKYKLSYWLLFASVRSFLCYIWENLQIQTKAGKTRGLMAFPGRDFLSRSSASNRNHKTAALHNYSAQCKQLWLKPLHSTTHLLTKAPTHIFMYSCVSQNLAVCIAIFSRWWWGNSLYWNGNIHKSIFFFFPPFGEIRNRLRKLLRMAHQINKIWLFFFSRLRNF